MDCKACRERGKTWQGDDPKCAFPEGVFIPENWNCATIGALRDICEAYNRTVWNEDQNAAIICGEEDAQHVVLTWYKRRGRTEGALMLNDGVATPLTLVEAERIVQRARAMVLNPAKA